MAAKDLFHEAVKRALEKDQWTITDDPLELEWEEADGVTTRAHTKSGLQSILIMRE